MGQIFTISAFLKTLRQSELLDEETLERKLRELRDGGVPLEEPQALAEAFVSRRVLTRWQADMLLQGKHRGFFLGKYRLLSLLGKGGMAAVYLAEHRMMHRRVAIKVLPPRKSGDSAFVSRFHREARAVAALDHVNIARMFDIDKDFDKETVVHFLVMEYVNGGSLQDLVATRGPLAYYAAADFVRQAADGLSHAHAAGVVHRDVTPANLLIDSTGVVKILDLGIAQFFGEVSAGPTLEVGHQYLGTPDYLAPEQALNSNSIDPRADVYGLGCTFYFLLAGHPPFPGGTAAQKLIAHQTLDPKPIRQLRPDLPIELTDILQKMMAKKKEDRWQSASEASQALRNWENQNSAREPRKSLVTKESSERVRDGTDLHRQSENTDTARTKTAPAASTGSPAPLGSSSSIMETSDKTLPERRRFSSRKPPSPHSRKSGNRRLKVILASLFGLLVGCYAMFYFASRSHVDAVRKKTEADHAEESEPQAAIPSDERAITTSEPPGAKSALTDPTNVTVGPKGDFLTIRAALDHIRRTYANRPLRSVGYVIRVAGGQTYAESIIISNSDLSFPNRVRIVAEGDQKAILAPAGREPVLQFTGPSKAAEQFTLDGFEIHADGKPTAIKIEGYVVGTRLMNLDVVGFERFGFLGTGVKGLGTGREADTFGLTNVHFCGLKESEGIRLDGAQSQHIRIDQCRFLGPMKSGIVVRDGVTNLAIRNCIFCENDQGIFVTGIGPVLRDFSIENNAFFKNRHGIVFSTFPSTRSNGLSFRRNVFLTLSGYPGTIDNAYDSSKFFSMLGSGGIHDNWTDRQQDEAPEITRGHELDLFQQNGRRGAEFRFQSTDPNDPGFLVPAEDSPHRTVGPNVRR